MRAYKIIKVMDGNVEKAVTVHELSVSQMRDALSILTAVTEDQEQGQGLQAIAATMLERASEPAMRLLHGVSSLEADIDNVGGLVLLDVVDAWVEVNQPFFDRLGQMGSKFFGRGEKGAEEIPKPQVV